MRLLCEHIFSANPCCPNHFQIAVSVDECSDNLAGCADSGAAASRLGLGRGAAAPAAPYGGRGGARGRPRAHRCGRKQLFSDTRHLIKPAISSSRAMPSCGYYPEPAGTWGGGRRRRALATFSCETAPKPSPFSPNSQRSRSQHPQSSSQTLPAAFLPR